MTVSPSPPESPERTTRPLAESRDAPSAAAKRCAPKRKPRGAEPGGLDLRGVIGAWCPRWRVGYLVGDDAVERNIEVGAFGPEGLKSVRAGLRVRFKLSADGKVRGCAQDKEAP